VIATVFSEYNIMWFLRVGCLHGVDRNISHVLKSKGVVFVLTLLYMCDGVVLWLFILSML
jgi:hypothetical protein